MTDRPMEVWKKTALRAVGKAHEALAAYGVQQLFICATCHEMLRVREDAEGVLAAECACKVRRWGR